MNLIKSAKLRALAMLEKLPQDCSFEDIHYHLYVLEKVQRGVESADRGGTLSQEAVEADVRAWLSR